MKNLKVRGISIVCVGLLVQMLWVMPLFAAGNKDLKIGGITILSGPLSEIGLGWARGWQLYFNKINEEGGLKVGTDKYQIKFIVEDSKFNPEGGATAATKLVYENGAKIVMGEIADFMTAAIHSVTSKAGALHVVSYLNVSAPVKGSIMDVSRDRPLMIRVHHATDEVFPYLYEYLLSTYPGVKTVAFTMVDFPEYAPYIPLCKALAERNGLKVVGITERFPAGTLDFFPIWTRILANKPDAVYSIVCGGMHPGMQLKAARQLGFKGPFFYSQPTDPDLVRTIAGPTSTDVFGAALAVDDPKLPASIKDIKKRWEAKYSDKFLSSAVFAWDTGWLLTQTIEKAQSVEPKDIVKTFETLTAAGSLQSVFGEARVGGLKTTGVNRVIVRPIPISRLINGRPEIIKFFTPEIK